MSKKDRYSFYMEVAMLERIDRLAKAQGVSRGRMVQDLIGDALEQSELTAKAASDPVIMPAMINAMSQPAVLRALMSVMKQDLSDDQLTLFQQSMNAAAGATPTKGKKRR